jgi:hypothetical protein
MEFRLTAPPAADSVPVAVLSSRMLGVLPLLRPGPSPELRFSVADPACNFLKPLLSNFCLRQGEMLGPDNAGRPGNPA